MDIKAVIDFAARSLAKKLGQECPRHAQPGMLAWQSRQAPRELFAPGYAIE